MRSLAANPCRRLMRHSSKPHCDASARANGTLLELDLLHTCQIQLMRPKATADVEDAIQRSDGCLAWLLYQATDYLRTLIKHSEPTTSGCAGPEPSLVYVEEPEPDFEEMAEWIARSRRAMPKLNNSMTMRTEVVRP